MDTAPFDKGGNGGFSGRVVSQKKSLGRVPIRRSRYDTSYNARNPFCGT